MGGHIQRDPSADVQALPWAASSRIILQALQKSGAFVGDFSEAISLYAANAPSALASCRAGLLDPYDISTVFKQDMLRKFRLLKMADDRAPGHPALPARCRSRPASLIRTRSATAKRQLDRLRLRVQKRQIDLCIDSE